MRASVEEELVSPSHSATSRGQDTKSEQLVDPAAGSQTRVAIQALDLTSTATKPRRRQAIKSGATEQLFLSVFLNLMAFFAVLVAISDFETQKSTLALDSIRDVFGYGELVPAPGPHDPVALAGVQLGSALNKLDSYLANLVQLRRLALQSEEGTIQMMFRPVDLFEEPSAAIRTEWNVLLVRMAALFGAPTNLWQLTLMASLPPNLPDVEAATARTLIERRLQTLIDGVVANGIPTDRISIRLRNGPDFQFGFELTEAFLATPVGRE